MWFLWYAFPMKQEYLAESIQRAKEVKKIKWMLAIQGAGFLCLLYLFVERLIQGEL